MFLTEKMVSRIKGSTCSIGIKQQRYTKKGDSASKIVSLEDIIITSDIEAHKIRDMFTIYITVA